MQPTPVPFSERFAVTPACVGARVRHVRNQLRLAPAEMAKLLGLADPGALAKVEEGREQLRAEQLLALAELPQCPELDFFLSPLHVTGEAQFSWCGETAGVDLKALEERAGCWVGLLRWLRQQTEGTQDPMEVLFVDLCPRRGGVTGGACQVPGLHVMFFNRPDMTHPGSKKEPPKPFSGALVMRLHMALQRGWLSARKAARTLGVDLFELGALFEAYGLTDPTRS